MTFLKQTIALLLILFFAAVATAQSVDSYPPLSVTIFFKYRSIYLSPREKAKLDSVYTIMKNYPKCKIRVDGYGHAGEDEHKQVGM